MNKPLISVVVPLYRVEAEMPLCVDSVLAQTYDRLDVILVDDGSPDGCGRLAEDYARRDARVRAIHRENGGLSAARNTGTVGTFMGVGMGGAFGNAMNNAFSNLGNAQDAAPKQETKPKQKYCGECGAAMSVGAKFCPECGNKF